MGDLAQDGALCLICHESLLSQVPCALRCGHVYHSVCCHQWFEKGKGECPQCKSKSGRDELFLLDFEVATVQPRSREEVRRLEAATVEERNQLREDFALELEDVESRYRETLDELEEQREASKAHKQARRELDLHGPELEAELVKLRADRETRVLNNASLGAQVDHQNNRQRQARSRTYGRSQDVVNEDDHDAKEERRKLKVMRPGDRARQLHEAVVNARMQEAEVRSSQQRDNGSKELEAELAEARKREARLHTELRQVRERHQEELSSEAGGMPLERKAPAAGAQGDGAPAQKRPRQAPALSALLAGATVDPRGGTSGGGEEDLNGGASLRRNAAILPAAGGSKANRLGTSSGAAAVEPPGRPDEEDALYSGAPVRRGTSILKAPAAAGPGRPHAGPAAAEASGGGDDEDLLYGSAPVRRGASVFLAARSAAPVPSARSSTPSNVVASLATPSRRQNSLQALFSRKQA